MTSNKRSAQEAGLDAKPEGNPDQPTYEQLARSHFSSRLPKPSPLQQLHLEFDKGAKGDYRRTLFLVREVVKQPGLPKDFAWRLLTFCALEDIEYLTRQVLVNQPVQVNTLEGGKLLWTALDANRHEAAATLVEFGADLSVQNGSTVLHAAMRNKKLVKMELVRQILKRGVDIHACDAAGRTALDYAVARKQSSVGVVQFLLKNGARLSNEHLLMATHRKPELLPTLIEHPEVETRNRRGAMAIEFMIARQWASEKQTASIKGLLELGVPLDGDDPFVEKRFGRRPTSLLSLALFCQEKAVVKLLLDEGADPHRKNEFGHTPLFQATTFRSCTEASRWLIERGAGIHDRNNDGCYPIHGACETKSSKNLHLLLDLGANPNVTNNEGLTPFCYTDDTGRSNATHTLLIKYLALTIARGGRINDQDMMAINKHYWSEVHFKKCMMQLEHMKLEKVYDDIEYFALLSEDMYGKMQLIKNPNFAKAFKQNEKERANLFPKYSSMLLHSFEIADRRNQVLQEEKKPIRAIFSGVLPDGVIEKIAYHLNIEKLRRCHHDYYMSFHANLANNKAKKRKLV